MLTNEVVSFLAHRALLRLDHFENNLLMLYCCYVYNNFSSFSAKLKFSHKRESLSMLTNEVVSFLAHRALLRLDHF